MPRTPRVPPSPEEAPDKASRETLGCSVATVLFLGGLAFFGRSICADEDARESRQRQQYSDALQWCEGKGGTYYCAYRSGCVCLSPEVVLRPGPADTPAAGKGP